MLLRFAPTAVRQHIRRVARLVLARGWECFHADAPVHDLDRYEYTTYILAMRHLQLNRRWYELLTRRIISDGIRVGDVCKCFGELVCEKIIWTECTDHWLKIIVTYTLAWCVAKEIDNKPNAHHAIAEIFDYAVRMTDQRFGYLMHNGWVSCAVTSLSTEKNAHRMGFLTTH